MSMIDFQSNLGALRRVGVAQQVSANNIANVQTPDFKETRVTFGTDRVTLQKTSAPTAVFAHGVQGSNVDVGQNIANMSFDKHVLAYNVKAIAVQEDMFRAVLDIKA